ncbi:MAG: hypothetical protein N2447_00435 [Thermoanaerobaculum sp.]|nr:hypothetical protein [Thermoanaerobaculum sp.]
MGKRVLLLGFLVALGACATGVPTDTPGVERMGATVLRYRGPEVELALGYRFATLSLGEEWLMVDLAVTAAAGKVVEVQRDRIWVVTPSGQQLPLASQEEFAAVYPRLQPTLRRAALAADPLGYFSRELTCSLGFFAAPGEGLVFPSVHLDDRRVCEGPLYFFVPGGIQPGRWVLALDVVESQVRIPFYLGEPHRRR